MRVAMPRRRKKMADDDRDDNGSLANPRGSFSPEELDGMGEEELTRLVEAALDRLPVQWLVAVAVAAEERRQARAEDTRQRLLQEFEDRVKAEGLTLEQVFPVLAYGARRGRSRSVGAVKYRGPHNEEWSGKGRPPRWLAMLESEGRNREEFRVPSE
jgi:DNA-binding protein H-NS